jgi:hypothetical protein
MRSSHAGVSGNNGLVTAACRCARLALENLTASDQPRDIPRPIRRAASTNARQGRCAQAHAVVLYANRVRRPAIAENRSGRIDALVPCGRASTAEFEPPSTSAPVLGWGGRSARPFAGRLRRSPQLGATDSLRFSVNTEIRRRWHRAYRLPGYLTSSFRARNPGKTSWN